MTIKELSELLGVSPATISRVLNHKATGHVSQEKQELVLKAVSKLGYTPSKLAQSLRKRSTQTIGVVVPDISNPFFATLVRGVELYCTNNGLLCFICDSNNSSSVEKQHLINLVAARVEGIILISTGSIDDEVIQKINQYKIKVVAADRRLRGLPVVEADNFTGSILITNYVISLGYKSIVYIAGPQHISTAQDRLKGFLTSLRLNNIEPFAIIDGNFTFNSGYNCTLKLIKSYGRKIEIIMCGNDLMAFGAMRAIMEAGYTVPDEIGITGFDGLSWARLVSPPLCTVYVPAFDIGFQAAEMLASQRSMDVTLPVEFRPGATIRGVC
jgi:LacI family transcriptional regulator